MQAKSSTPPIQFPDRDLMLVDTHEETIETSGKKERKEKKRNSKVKENRHGRNVTDKAYC
jgi:hypothetical protein